MKKRAKKIKMALLRALLKSIYKDRVKPLTIDLDGRYIHIVQVDLEGLVAAHNRAAKYVYWDCSKGTAEEMIWGSKSRRGQEMAKR